LADYLDDQFGGSPCPGQALPILELAHYAVDRLAVNHRCNDFIQSARVGLTGAAQPATRQG